MTSAVLDPIADAQTAAEDATEETAGKFRARFDERLSDPEQLIDALLVDAAEELELSDEALDLAIESSLDDLAAVPMSERDAAWAGALDLLVVVSEAQAMFETFGPQRALEASAGDVKRAVRAARRMDVPQLREAAREGVTKARMEDSRARRGANRTSD